VGQRGPFRVVANVWQLTDLVAQYAEARANELIVHFNPRLPLAQRLELWSTFMREVAPRFDDNRIWDRFG
jgi:hypothetical protein